ncbi:uncharacterized protein LOC119559375 [Drosophila subpulchrella]|uniref:uncharacterized protein LOC119559375 n=1 Tax=Drosophila subpulchrella TaxID=1486046 RepID=UPI0018A1A25C|nr:uncharacterized protein LOC119559375 [Drosophila subpulchrella]
MLVVTGGIPKTLGVSVGSGLVIAIAMGGSRCPAHFYANNTWLKSNPISTTSHFVNPFICSKLNGVPEANSKCHNNQLAIKWRPFLPPPTPIALVIQNLLNDVRLPITN